MLGERTKYNMEKRIENTKKGVKAIIYDNGNVTLLKGSMVSKETKKSLSPALLTLRSTNGVLDANGALAKDLSFASQSAAASFIQGAQTNGKAYFAPFLSSTEETKSEKPTASKPKAKASKEASAPKQTELDTPRALTKGEEQHADEVAQKVRTFCKDFAPTANWPDTRQINSLRFLSTAAEGGQYLANCLELIGQPSDMLELCKAKCKSAEWKNIFEELKACPLSHGRFNQRLEIFYGPAGTGKTSRAIAENPTATRIVASATQDPSELFTRNVVNDHGGVDVVLTELGQAMVDGKPIIIDEVNLYQQCVMTRLQGATDGGKFLTDNGVNLTIKDGFKIVGTMNLETNLGKTALPDPLVSRAAKVEKMEAPYLGWVF